MHITITGNLGSGKSTVCRLLSDQYQYEIYSTGKVQRELARQMNMTTLELNKLMCSDRKYDKMIDDETARISRENRDKNIIFDSRLAWHFVEHSFKVFVSVSLEVAAERVMKDQRGAEEKYSSLEEAKKLLAERAATENVRYKDIYNLKYMEYSNYNLIIDSTYGTPDQIAEIILKEAEIYEEQYQREGTESFKILLSPRRLIQESEISGEDRQELKALAKEYEGAYAARQTVRVSKQGEDYLVQEGLSYVKAAYIAQVPYVSVMMQ